VPFGATPLAPPALGGLCPSSRAVGGGTVGTAAWAAALAGTLGFAGTLGLAGPLGAVPQFPGQVYEGGLRGLELCLRLAHFRVERVALGTEPLVLFRQPSRDGTQASDLRRVRLSWSDVSGVREQGGIQTAALEVLPRPEFRCHHQSFRRVSSGSTTFVFSLHT
jgi:hypothetical protein